MKTEREKTIRRYFNEFAKDFMYIGWNNPYRKGLKHDVYEIIQEKGFTKKSLTYCIKTLNK